jgi:hypothetical protein
MVFSRLTSVRRQPFAACVLAAALALPVLGGLYSQLMTVPILAALPLHNSTGGSCTLIQTGTVSQQCSLNRTRCCRGLVANAVVDSHVQAASAEMTGPTIIPTPVGVRINSPAACAWAGHLQRSGRAGV